MTLVLAFFAGLLLSKPTTAPMPRETNYKLALPSLIPPTLQQLRIGTNVGVRLLPGSEQSVSIQYSLGQVFDVDL